MGPDLKLTSDDQSRQDATGRDSEPHTISVAEAADLFTVSGLPRTERAIQRFCKKGDLICAFQDTAYGSRYLIKRTSIDRLIQQKLQALSITPDTDSGDTSRPDATGRDKSRQEGDTLPIIDLPSHEPMRESVVPSRDTEPRNSATSQDEFQTLHEENLSLKIDNSARQQFINHLTNELEKSHERNRELSYNLGVAHTKVAQLEAPRSTPETSETKSDEMSRLVATTESEDILMPDPIGEEKENVIDAPPPPIPTITSEPEKPSFLRKLFG